MWAARPAKAQIKLYQGEVLNGLEGVRSVELPSGDSEIVFEVRGLQTPPEEKVMVVVNAATIANDFSVIASRPEDFPLLLEQVTELAPEEVVDPSSLLFYRSVGYHRLLNRDAGLQAIGQLLGSVAEVPQRFRAVATLMQSDLEKLDDKTLDHIARRMDDIRRRLDLGRAGEKVVKVEDGVIESLDKLIEEMEKQQQQQGGKRSTRNKRSNRKTHRRKGKGRTRRGKKQRMVRLTQH